MPNETSALEVLRAFSENRAIQLSGQDKRWRWRNGTFLFPEARCCYCGRAVRSNRLWVADPGWLRGQLKLDGDKAVWERPNHPHAGTDGGMCLGGTTEDLVTILFFAVNPLDTLRWHGDVIAAATGIRAWYAEMFGHTCAVGGSEATGVLKVADGIFAAMTPVHRDRRPRCGCECRCSPDVGPCECGHEQCVCLPELVNCMTCQVESSWYDMFADPAGGDGRLCHACWQATCIECNWCGRSWLRADGLHVTGENGNSYCPEHVEHGRQVRPADGLAMAQNTGQIPWATTTMPTMVWHDMPATMLTATGETMRLQAARQRVATRRARRRIT